MLRASSDEEIPQCDKALDVAFVMDTSGSIGHIDYQKEKDFVKLLATSFAISSTHSHAAIVLYNDTASIKVGLNQHVSTAAFHSAVNKLPYERGRTRIDKALELVHSKVFVRARSGIPKIVIVLTDGRQTKDPGAKDLKEASEPLRRAGVRILAVGVGEADRDELRLMTESASDVFFAKDFGELKLRVGEIAEVACRSGGMFLDLLLLDSIEFNLFPSLTLFVN